MNAAIAAWLERTVAAAPPLTDDRRARIEALLTPTAADVQRTHPPAGPHTPPPPPGPKERAAA